MTPDPTLLLGALLLVVLVLQVVLLLRRPEPLAARLDQLAAGQDRLGDRLVELQRDRGQLELAVARGFAEATERLTSQSMDQHRVLGEQIAGASRAVTAQTERLAAQDSARIERDAATQAVLAERLTAQDRALAERTAAAQALLAERLAAQDLALAERDAAAQAALAATLSRQAEASAEALANLRRDQATAAGELRTELVEAQRRLQAAQAEEANRARDLLESKLKEMREGNDARLAEIQKSVNEQLAGAVEKQMTDSFARVIDQFAAVQKAMGDVQAVTSQIGDIKRLFSNVKTRGGWGETQVRLLLDDILPPGSYEMNRKLREGSAELVEFAVIMPMRGEPHVYMAIDAKFPVEDYERLILAAEAGDLEAEREARRALERRVKLEAQKIAAKYICPPVTVEHAVLYLPTDGLFAEVARVPGLIEEINRSCHVQVLGPSLLPALLRVIQLGYVTLSLEQKSDMVRELLGATRAEMIKMDGVLEKLAKNVGTMGNSIALARTRTRAVNRKLKGIDALGFERAAEVLELTGEPDELPEEAGEESEL
jgi:DNA recombination protein RmuC